MYLIYNNSAKKYDCTVDANNGNIEVTFEEEFEANTTGFKLFLDNGKLIGDYSDYTNIVESKADGFTFSISGEEESNIPSEKTLGEKLEDAINKIDFLQRQVDMTNEALEEFILDVYSVSEEENV